MSFRPRHESLGRGFEDFTERAPFAGLVKSKPARALAALRMETDAGRFPEAFWGELFSDWPDGASPRLIELCTMRLAALPSSTAAGLSHQLASWAEKHLPGLAIVSNSRFANAWDRIYSVLASGGAKSTDSGIGDVSVGGRSIKTSRKTLDYAINGPVGHLVECLLKCLHDGKWKKGEKLPRYLADRLFVTLGSPGEGAGHATCILATRLSWFHYVDPSWTSRSLASTL